MAILLQFFDIVLTIIWLALLGRVILSWVNVFTPGKPLISPNNPVVLLLYQLTDPILGPLRRVVPTIGNFDFTPLIAFFLIVLLREFIAGI